VVEPGMAASPAQPASGDDGLTCRRG
jgi:hypothetical protein